MPVKIDENRLRVLAQSDEDQLLEQLGLRAAAVGEDLSLSVELYPEISAGTIAMMGPKDELKNLGRRILRQWYRSAYELACGTAVDDNKARADIRQALGIGEAAAIAALTQALIAIGLMPALAPLVAAILIKKFFNPAYDQFCRFWQEKLLEREIP